MKKGWVITGLKVFTAFILTLLGFVLSPFSPLVAQEIKWEERSPETVPAGRDDHMMTFDSERGYVVMFGGDNGGNVTWLWDGTNWIPLDPETKPAAKREAAFAFDSIRKVSVLFGGYDLVLGDVVNITWEFDGEQWVAKGPANAPTRRKNHAMAFDAERGLMILFGGDIDDNQTWAYDGVDWTVVNEEGNGPDPRGAHGMVYDSNRKKIVLFGGSSGNTYYLDTWEWDGTTWQNVSPEIIEGEEDDHPPAMRAFAMVYDSHRKKTVLYGGRDGSLEGFDLTWEWDGVAWQKAEAINFPPKRHECAAAFDSARNRMVLFGGSSGETEESRYMNDTWWYPNGPPVFKHKPLLGAYPDRDAKINTELIDYDGDKIEATLYYRDTGDLGYNAIPMDLTDSTSFSAVVPAGEFSNDGFEYYLQAGDPRGSGLLTMEGSGDNPFSVSVGTVGSIKLRIKPKEARELGALWRPDGTDEWLKSGSVVKNLKPGKLEIQFKSIEDYNKPQDFIVYVVHGKRTAYEAKYVPKESNQ